jgi:replicative superfamily II helicase
MLSEIISGELDATSLITDALFDIHKNGPSNPSTFETLAYIKRFQPDSLVKYEGRLINLMGLFYKSGEPNSLIEQVYAIYRDSIRECFGKTYTPLQASAYKEIDERKYFSFSAPTSAGKSYLFRDVIGAYEKDIVIIVPSRALISEYYYEVASVVRNDVLVLQFVDDIYKDCTKRRIYIVTPERAVELFKYKETFNLGLILMDEAQISEEEIRGIKFDAFVRRSDKAFPESKKIFTHPFISNPEAQLRKHGFDNNSSAKVYDLHSVGKIFVSHRRGKFKYFSPYKEDEAQVATESDIVSDVLDNGGTALIYVSKSSIYKGSFILNFATYIDKCQRLTDPEALKIIESLRLYIGASKDDSEHRSTLVNMMEKGIVVHHGSMPLKARLMVERFIRNNHAKLCFATSTLNQGINMPFDIVWIDNFRNMDALTLKNLIGRSGRTSQDKSRYDYGYTIINSQNVRTFLERIASDVVITQESRLDIDAKQDNDDLQDVIDAVRDDTFDDDLHLPQVQIERIMEADLSSEMQLILDNLISDDTLISADSYYKLENKVRDSIKSAFKRIYIQHLRRDELTSAEAGVLSAAIPIMLWHIQGRSFSEIVSLRYAFLSERDQRRSVMRMLRQEEISAEEAKDRIEAIKVRRSPVAFSLPQKNHSAAPLYPLGTSVNDIDYDQIVYDTYDYLDKVIALSISDPLCAAFAVHYERTQDARAVSMQNFIRFGTNDGMEIWLMRYGIDPEDIDWIKPHIASISERNIEFRDSILEESEDRLSIIDRYL